MIRLRRGCWTNVFIGHWTTSMSIYSKHVSYFPEIHQQMLQSEIHGSWFLVIAWFMVIVIAWFMVIAWGSKLLLYSFSVDDKFYIIVCTCDPYFIINEKHSQYWILVYIFLLSSYVIKKMLWRGLFVSEVISFSASHRKFVGSEVRVQHGARGHTCVVSCAQTFFFFDPLILFIVGLYKIVNI